MQADFTEVYKGAGIERTETRYPFAKKTWQDALGIPFSQGEAVCQRREGRVAVRSRSAAGAKNGAEKAGGSAFSDRISLGKSNLQKELQGLSLATDARCGEPETRCCVAFRTAMGERVEEILLEVNPQNQIVRISVTEADGSLTEYRFHNLRENDVIADDPFRFFRRLGRKSIQGDLGP